MGSEKGIPSIVVLFCRGPGGVAPAQFETLIVMPLSHHIPLNATADYVGLLKENETIFKATDSSNFAGFLRNPDKIQISGRL